MYKIKNFQKPESAAKCAQYDYVVRLKSPECCYRRAARMQCSPNMFAERVATALS